MRLAYVAGPYRSRDGPYGIMQNIRAAERVALELWQRGFAVICPHKNAAFFDGAADDDVWLKGDLEMLSRCDMCVMVPGWEQSSGATAERMFALQHKIKVYYYVPEDQRVGPLANILLRA